MDTPEKVDEATLPLLTPKTAGGSQRVIKQIVVIDPNKLRLAGLDVKMAEALKSAKRKSQPKSKESKLAAAKSILNKKLKEALSKKDSAKETSSTATPSKNVKSIEEAAKKLSSSEKTKVGKTKPKISVATLKSLMPPPSFPVSSLISPNQTVEIKVLKSEKTKQSIEVKIVDSSGITPQKIEMFPKASLKTPKAPKLVKTQTITPEIKFEVKQKLSLLGNPDEPEASSQSSGASSQTVIVHVEEKTQNVKSKNTSRSVPSKSLTKEVEPAKNMTPGAVHRESSLNEEKSLNEKTNPLVNQEESLVAEAETSIELTSLSPIYVESLPSASESSLEIINSTPIRRESLPKVIESKVLSPGEKIDLSILTKKSPAALTVPKKRYKLDQNWITSESNRAEPVYINLSPVLKPTPPQPVAQESAVDFINNLSLFFAESQKNKSQTKDVPEILTKECGEDATSFLVSLFQQKQDTSPKTETTAVEKKQDASPKTQITATEKKQDASPKAQTTAIEKNEGSKEAPAKSESRTNYDQIEQKLSGQDSISQTSSNTINIQASVQEEKDSPNKKNKTKKDLQLVEDVLKKKLDTSQITPKICSENTLHEVNIDASQNSPNLCSEKALPETILVDSQSSPKLHSDKTSVQENKSMISNSENDKKSIEPMEHPSDLDKTVSNATLLSLEEDRGLADMSVSLISQSSSVTECIQEPIPESSTPPVSSRRKTNKPIPVLIPKLRKSRKPPTLAQKPPEDIIPQKTAEKPEKESPTQPVPNKEACTDSVSNVSAPCQTAEEKENPHKSVQTATEKTQRKRRDTPKSREQSPATIHTSPSKDSSQIETPTTNKTERPQRQRKISLKLIESSEFQGVVDRTVEQMIKNKKDWATGTERPQRQRKVSFKLLNSSDTLSTIVKPSIQTLENSNAQEIKEKIELATTTERPQRQRRITFKLLESSEALPTIKSLVQVKNRSVEQEIKEKTQLGIETETPQCAEKNAENKNSDSLISIEMKNDASKDPIAQLMAFHETVEKFELACGSVKSKQTQNTTSILEGEGSSLSEYPFYDAICSEMSGELVQSNQPTEGKENVSGEKTSTKVLRKRKDSLKSRKFVGEQISIVSSDSLGIVDSEKQTRKSKETNTNPLSETEDVPAIFESTPKQSETKTHARNLIPEMVDNEEEFSLNSNETVNKSETVENLNASTNFSTQSQSQSTNVETPTSTIGKKRRGRPPKLQKRSRNPIAAVSQLTAANSSVEPITDLICKSDNLGGSWETLPSTDDHLSQDVTQVKSVEKVDEVSLPSTSNSSIQPRKTDICESLGSWETLPSADELLSQEVTIINKSGSNITKKKTGKYKVNSLKRKGQDVTPDKEDKGEQVPEINNTIEKNTCEAEEICINAGDDKKKVHKIQEEVVIIEDNEAPKLNKRRGRPPKNSNYPDTLNQLRIGVNVSPTSIRPPKVSNISEKHALKMMIESEVQIANDNETLPGGCAKISEKKLLKTTKEPIDFSEKNEEVQNQGEKPSTSKSKQMSDIVAECKEGNDMAGPKEVLNAPTNTPDDYETPESTTIENSETSFSEPIKTSESILSADVDKTSPKKTFESSKVKLNVNKEQLILRDDPTDYVGSESRTVEPQSCGKQQILKNGLFDQLKSPTKLNESENKEFQVNELKDKDGTVKSYFCDLLKTSKINPDDCLEPSTSEYEVSQGQSTSVVDSCDHLKLSGTSRAIETEQENKSHLSVVQSTNRANLFDDIKSLEGTNLPKTKDPPKIVSNFEDLIFDLDHIESPSFSPICESSRISNDSDGFEELDEDFTSAIIDTVTEAENSVEKSVSVEDQTLEKSLNTSFVAEKFHKDSNPTQESKSFNLVDPTSDNDPKATGDKKTEEVKESSALDSSVLPTEDSKNCDKNKQSLSLPSSGGLSLSSSSIPANILPEESKQIEHPISSVFSSSETSPVVIEKSDQDKESPSLVFSAHGKKPLDRSQRLENPKSEKVELNCPLHSSDLSKKSPKDPKSTEELTSDKINQSSALYSAVLNSSDPNQKEARKNKATNPFKRKIPKEGDKEKGIKSQTDFLGFNEKEIEEGQQSTSLRLSQSDAESLNIESPSTSNIKQEQTIKESQRISWRKQKLEEQKWEKNSAKSLKNWLSKPVKKGSTVDVCDNKEDTKEQSSSVPPKKRQSKVQNLTAPIPLEEDVEHLEEEITNENSTIKQITEVNVSVIEEKGNSSDKKEKPKRGRKPKLKNIVKDEDKTSSIEDTNSASKSFERSLKSLLEDGDTSIDKTPKRRRKLKVPNDEEFKTPRNPRKSKVVDQSISVAVKEESSENLLTPLKGRANKRKRSVSEENTPSTTEPPTKVSNLDGDLITSHLFQTVRKKGRPKKSTVLDISQVVKTAVVKNSPMQKKYKDDYEFNPRLLLVRNREELKSNEPLVDPNLQTEPTGPDDVQCALCMGYAPRKKWIQHVSSHYGIGWIVGQPPPLNINSRGSILSFMIEFYKVSKVKGLNCRLCNSLRRSGLGLMMHLEQCCLTQEELNETRVECEYCKRNYTKASYLQHKRTCSEYLKLILEEEKAKAPEIPEGTTPEDVLSNTGRLKRKAVIKAETKLKKLDEAPEFSPDDLIKYIPSENIRSIESVKENWIMEINSFGKGFCASKVCRFTATTIDDLIDHYQEKVCPYYEKAGYFCVRCKFHSDNIETVRSHVIERHPPKSSRGKADSDAEVDSAESSESISSGDDEVESGSGSFEVDENGERKPKRTKKPKLKARRRPFHSKNPPTKEYKKLLPDRCSNITELVARFYDKFIETNYSLDPLFTFAKTNFVYMEASESYFPKSADSMKFIHNGFHGFVKFLGQSKVEADKWKQLERLHGLTDNGEYTMYMGGPVKNIAWVPLDPNPPSNTQYLAVTVRKGLDKFIRFFNQKRSRSLIFILKFDISLPGQIKGEIIYAIAIDDGPIHTIEFLPSGGYSPQMNRLGMLAVGTIETEIKIYSLPLKVEKLDCDLFPVVRLEASIELHLELLDNPSDKTDIYSSQCTCVVWSKTAGHNIIVGSFLNGFVGIWDISDDVGNLNRFDLNEKKSFTPVSYFWTSEDRLMHLALHYDMNGPRWLVTSNSTRKMLLYDLRDITQPMLLRVEVTINIINSIEWPIAWENIFFGLGDAMPSNGCVLSAFSPMSIMFQTRRFDKFCAGLTDIHFNIWKNSFAAGGDNGDVQLTVLREGVLDVAQRLKTDDKTIFTLDIVPLNGEKISQNGMQTPSDGMRVFDKDCKDQYGIVFGSFRKIKGCNRPEYYSAQRVPPLNLHRLMRVSKIRCNQNKNACDLLAIGYDNGFLRVCMRDLLKKD